jgi:hypothetical protein
MRSRRAFLYTAAATAAGLAAIPSRAEAAAPARSRALRVRRNINSLDPNGPEVATLRAGVKAMQALNPATGLPTNPKSWGYQRGIHRYSSTPNPLPTAWNTCTHHGSPSAAFVSWHRAYLYYFERICRAVSGDDSFTLPYWNYDIPGQNVMPWPFLDQMAGNPLRYSPRGSGINDGDALDPTDLGEEFTVSESDFTVFQDALQTCHDNTHGAVGGSMGSVATAALDPIFYLHHANIDRCWRHWQKVHLGSADPSPLPSWWTTPWTFFDENGNAVQMTGQQAEHTESLGYGYHHEPVSPIVIAVAVPFKTKLMTVCQRFPRLCEALMVPQPRRPPWPLPLNLKQPVAPLPIRLPGSAVQALWETKRSGGAALSRGLLMLELILEWREGGPLVVAEARPAGTKGNTGWVRGGSVSSFARGSAGARDTVQIDVSRVFSVLGRQASTQELEWRVRFSSGRLGPDGRERPIRDTTAAEARIWGARLVIPEASRR